MFHRSSNPIWWYPYMRADLQKLAWQEIPVLAWFIRSFKCCSGLKMTFLKDIRHVLLFYVLGDTITTIYALQTGYFYEGNPILFRIFATYGYISLIPLKIAFMFLLYHVYRNANRYFWNITRYSVSFIGLLATLSNTLAVIHV